MQTVKNKFRIIDGGYWKLNLKDLNTFKHFRWVVLIRVFTKKTQVPFCFCLLFPDFPAVVGWH